MVILQLLASAIGLYQKEPRGVRVKAYLREVYYPTMGWDGMGWDDVTPQQEGG
jgi:hypothetical protein